MNEREVRAWTPSLRAIGKARDYQHYLELVEEEAAKLLVEETEQALQEAAS